MSVRLKKISLPEVRVSIAIAYQGDQELFDKYHIGKCDHLSATIKTMEMIREVSKEYDIANFKVIYDKKNIGYVSVFEGFLYSFGINKSYRKKDILIEWWQEIKKILGNRFFAQLYHNNTRAIEFLKRQGMKVVEDHKDEQTVLLVNEK